MRVCISHKNSFCDWQRLSWLKCFTNCPSLLHIHSGTTQAPLHEFLPHHGYPRLHLRHSNKSYKKATTRALTYLGMDNQVHWVETLLLKAMSHHACIHCGATSVKTSVIRGKVVAEEAAMMKTPLPFWQNAGYNAVLCFPTISKWPH